MKNKTAVLLVVALVCGLGAAYLTAKVIGDRSKPQQEEKVTVLVATKAVPPYQPVKEPEKFFATKQVSKADAPKGALTRMEDVKGKRLKVGLSQDKVLTQADLQDDKNPPGLPARVPEGTVAYSIKVTADSGVGGFVQPQSRVDVIAVLKRGDNVSMVLTVLQNVLVLATGGITEPDAERQSVVVPTVTLAVKPDEADQLALLQDKALLRLSLRREGDETQRETKGKTLREAFGTKLGEALEPTVVDNTKPNGGTGEPGTSLPTVPTPTSDKPTPVWSIKVREGDKFRTVNYYRTKGGAIVTDEELARLEKLEVRKDDAPATQPTVEVKD